MVNGVLHLQFTTGITYGHRIILSLVVTRAQQPRTQ
jgi:hypothetical protein